MLAIVERSGDAQCTNVAAEASELMRLAWRHAAVGIKYDYAKMRQCIKCRSHGRAGIAGGGHDDGQRFFFVAAQSPHAGGEKSRTEILERRRRPVKEFERIVVLRCQSPQRRVEGERFGANRIEMIRQCVVREKRTQ